MQVMESLSLLSAVFEDVVCAVENLEAHYKDVGDSAKRNAVASEVEGPSHSGSLNHSRTMPTRQSAIKEQSERLKEEISRREHELKQIVDILEKTYKECLKKLERLVKEQDLQGKKVVVDRPCEQSRELVEQRKKVEEMTDSETTLRNQNTPWVQMTTVKVPPSTPCTLFMHLPMLTLATVNSMAASFSPLSGIVYSSTPIVSQASVSQMTTIGGQLSYQHQPLHTLVNSTQTMRVQSSTVFPPIASLHHVYETEAGTHTVEQPSSSHNQFQSTPGTGLNSTNDQLSIDSSAALKRVSIPKFAGNKKHYEAWKAAFNLCVDQARAAPEYKLLRLHECLQGEAPKVIENLGHSAAAYETAKS